jgi:GNAT superfamily N-acetyltransferase
MDWCLRLATDDDIPELEKLIERSVRQLQAKYYSPVQMEGALGTVFGVDRQLIRDQTYFVIAQDQALVACGGWSKRESLFGSSVARAGEDAMLDPACDPARIRAFFVHPGHARLGLGRAILFACEDAIRAAEFRSIELVATLPGVPFYRVFDYQTGERYEVSLVNGSSLPVVPMFKKLTSQ